MVKHSRCIIGVCENKIRYPELQKKLSNVDVQTSNPLTATDNSRNFSYACCL